MAAVSSSDDAHVVEFIHIVNPTDSAYPATQPILLPGGDDANAESVA